ILPQLSGLNWKVFYLDLAPPQRFSEGKGVFIPLLDVHQKFIQLRQRLLCKEGLLPRFHEAHITIMHPRNSTCTDAIFEEIIAVKLPKKLKISRISLIEQVIGEKWKVLDEFSLLA
ncbi:MAG: 2'-5' RNA ligase family protein, partial [Bacteroidota bacterium]